MSNPNVGRVHAAIEAAGVTVTSVRNTGGTLTAVYPDGTSQADKDTGDAIVARGDDYVVFKDGANELDDDALVTIAADDTATKVIDVQYKNANDTDGTEQDAMTIECGGGLIPISVLAGTLDVNGKMTITLGPTALRGECYISIQGGPTPDRKLRVKFE